MEQIVGVGVSGIYIANEQPLPRFQTDEYVANEELFGIGNSMAAMAFGLTTSERDEVLPVEPVAPPVEPVTPPVEPVTPPVTEVPANTDNQQSLKSSGSSGGAFIWWSIALLAVCFRRTLRSRD